MWRSTAEEPLLDFDCIRSPGRRRLPGSNALAVGSAALLVLLGSASPHVSRAEGVGDLLVAPTRVVFGGRARSAQLTLVNRGAEHAVYRITLEKRRMLEDGRFEEVVEEQSDELFATDLIRFAPRRVDLAPNQFQTIRLLLRKPRDLPAGEYRSHLLFRAVPENAAAQSIDDTTKRDQGVSVRLIPIYGVTIPVIVRHGNLQADVGIVGAELQTTRAHGAAPVLSVRMVRSGQRSVYGNLLVGSLGEDGIERTIGQLGGVAIYSPNRARTVRVPLDPSYAAGAKPRNIRVRYLATDDDGAGTLAEKKLEIR